MAFEPANEPALLQETFMDFALIYFVTWCCPFVTGLSEAPSSAVGVASLFIYSTPSSIPVCNFGTLVWYLLRVRFGKLSGALCAPILVLAPDSDFCLLTCFTFLFCVPYWMALVVWFYA